MVVPVAVAEDIAIAYQLQTRRQLSTRLDVLPVRLPAVPLLTGAPVQRQRHGTPGPHLGDERVGHLDVWRMGGIQPSRELNVCYAWPILVVWTGSMDWMYGQEVWIG